MTKPITFTGGQLVVNYAAGQGGSVQVELLDGDGAPLPGFASAESVTLHGDAVKRQVVWRNGATPGSLTGQPVRVRFVLKNADLYSFQFVDEDEASGHGSVSDQVL